MLANKFKYRLTVIPCKYCKSTDIELYEDNKEESKEKFSTGGAVCCVCKNNVSFNKLPQVPSMSMLLDEWNKFNKE